MTPVKEDKILSDICREYNIELPNNLQNITIYEEIRNFKDAEYIYCIAYEMLIRTDEYNTLLKEYEPLKNKSKQNMTDDEFLKLRELIKKMNDLGLKKTSFLGFDCGDDKEHVFKKIEYYNEIINSPWNVRMLHKFQLDSDENIFYLLANFYLEKGKLYKLVNDDYYYPIPQKAKELVINSLKEYSQWKTEEQYNEFYNLLDSYFIPCILDSTDKIEYKSLSSNNIYLKELDKNFLSTINEKKHENLLIQAKADFTHYNINFWNKFYINDIKNGLNKLIEFHVNRKLIYNQNIQHTSASIDEILKNPSNFYIPCVNRLTPPIIVKWDIESNMLLDNNFIKNLKFDGIKSILGNRGYITVRKEENIHLVQLNEYISLSLLDDSFLETLTYEDLKNIYINTEPKFSRPRLMFDEAKLTNIPINLNLSKEDLLLYLSQIKDEYDRDKNIVKTDKEYFFNLPLESEFTQMPTHIKHANIKRTPNDKKLLPVKRNEFKRNFASAFYLYDLNKFFLPYYDKYIEEKRNAIKTENNLKIQKIKEERGIYPIEHEIINDNKKIVKSNIANYENNIIKQLFNLVEDLSEEQIEYYLTTMKEFIHGVNLKEEKNSLKKTNNTEKDEKPNPKYKDLIIGNSNIIKSNKQELIKKLID